MTSLSTSYYQIFLSQAILSSIGSGAVFNAALSSTATWFLKKRGAAFGIVNSGSSVGGVVLPIMMDRLFKSIGFAWALRVLGFLLLALCAVACATVKSRLPPAPRPLLVADYTKPFKERPMALTMLGGFLFFWGMYLPMNYIIIQAKASGISASVTPYLLSIINAVSIVGRIVPGFAADKFGRYNCMIGIVSLSGITTLALWIPSTHNTAAIIAYAVVFGFTSGGYVTMLPACIAQISEIEKIGTRTGVAFLVTALGALTGSPIGGALVSAQGGSFLGLQLFCGISMLCSAVTFVAARHAQVGWRITGI